MIAFASFAQLDCHLHAKISISGSGIFSWIQKKSPDIFLFVMLAGVDKA